MGRGSKSSQTTFQPESGGGDVDSEGVTSTDAQKLSSNRVSRVIRESNFAALPRRPGTSGYHPAAAVNLAEAHRWVTLVDFMKLMRTLMEVDLDFSIPRYDSPPFGVHRRFPADKLYLCIDLAPVNIRLLRINLASWERNRKALCDTASEIMELLVNDDEEAAPVVYSRRVFESFFMLEWED